MVLTISSGSPAKGWRRGGGEQFVGEHELGPGDCRKRQSDRLVVDDESHLIAIDALEPPAETLAAVDRRVEFDPRLVAGEAREILALHQRPIDPRRAHLEEIGTVDR